MDTGLGAKAYAIIEQGKIGQILSSRPTDRRQLIEEAAGVTKYKARRRVGRAQARGRAAEPHPRRRHRLRGREAARRAEAAGRQGAALHAAARRAAAVGEGAVRPPLPRAGRGHRDGAGAGWPTRATARRPPRRAWPRSRIGPGAPAHRAGRGRRRPPPRRAKPVHARELEINRRQQQIAFDTQQAEMLHGRAAELDAERAAARGAARAGALGARGPPPGGGARPSGRATKPAAARRPRPTSTPAPSRPSKRSSRTSERARADVFAVMNTLTALGAALDIGGRPARARRRRRRSRSKSRPASSRPSWRRPGPSASSAAEALRRAQDGARRRAAWRARPANRSWPARASSTSGARATCARASRSSAAMTARLRSLEEIDTDRVGVRRRGPHGAGARQRQGRPDGRGGRLPRGRAAATSAPSRRASATCCSTSWSNASST